MNAGIKIYNQNNQVLINSNYKNIALLKVIDLKNITTQEFEFGNKPVIIVEELLSVNQNSASVGLKYDNGVYRVVVDNRHSSATQKLFIFGNPDNSQITEKAGLIIYQNNTGEVAFDSRLKYLNVLGDFVHDAVIDTNKKYGIIKRMPNGMNWTIENYKRSRGRYYYREKQWTEAYGIDNDRLKIFNRYTRNIDDFFIDRPAPNTNLQSPIPYKPLLVDISLVY